MTAPLPWQVEAKIGAMDFGTRGCEHLGPFPMLIPDEFVLLCRKCGWRSDAPKGGEQMPMPQGRP